LIDCPRLASLPGLRAVLGRGIRINYAKIFEGKLTWFGLFLIRKNVYLTRKTIFLIKKGISLTKKTFSIIKEIISLIRKTIFLTLERISLVREMIFLIKKVSNLIRKIINETRKTNSLMAKMIFPIRKIISKGNSAANRVQLCLLRQRARLAKSKCQFLANVVAKN
jgi:hypothetical protein